MDLTNGICCDEIEISCDSSTHSHESAPIVAPQPMIRNDDETESEETESTEPTYTVPMLEVSAHEHAAEVSFPQQHPIQFAQQFGPLIREPFLNFPFPLFSRRT